MSWKRVGFALLLVTIRAVAGAEPAPAAQATAIAAHSVLPIWPGVAPGSEGAQQVERTSPFPSGKFSVVRNVVQPTLTVYLPSPALATGTGVIVAPGGAFRFLTMDAEGHDVARWLAAHGIAAFVLKYRLVATAADDAQMWQDFMKVMAAGSSATASMDADGRLGVADGMQAVKVVRAHAKEWGVAPNRIGFMGFSAGAMVASNTLLLSTPADRPNFVAPIYGAPFGTLPTIPGGLPPVFLAYAADDDLVGGPIEAFYKALRAAGHRPELHVYAKGGHGFGMNKQGTSSDGWIEDFHRWLTALGLARPPGS
jgi:acetyl esterase/lipase